MDCSSPMYTDWVFLERTPFIAKRKGVIPTIDPGYGGGGGRSVLQCVHGRGRMPVDPLIPTIPGRSTSDFHQPGRHCLHQGEGAGVLICCCVSRFTIDCESLSRRSRVGGVTFLFFLMWWLGVTRTKRPLPILLRSWAFALVLLFWR